MQRQGRLGSNQDQEHITRQGVQLILHLLWFLFLLGLFGLFLLIILPFLAIFLLIAIPLLLIGVIIA